MRRWLALAAVALAPCAFASVTMLYNGAHAAVATCLPNLLPANTVAPDGSGVFVDATGNMCLPIGNASACGGGDPVFMLAALTDIGRTNYQVPAGGAVSTGSPTDNNAPYMVGSSSYGGNFTDGGQQSTDDAQNYATVQASNVLSNWAYDPTAGGGVAWPTNASPPAGQPNVSTCTANASTSYGQTLCIGGVTGNPPSSASGCGLTSAGDSPSNATAIMGQLYTAFFYLHAGQGFNLWDVQAAFRQTAGNWSAGYNPATGGYGVVNFNFTGSGANSITTPSQLYLEAPDYAITMNEQTSATLTLFPFRTTRRAYEVIAAVNPAYVWPVKNEYTAADLSAAGITVLHTTSGDSSVEPSFTYQPAIAGTVTFVVFTTDGAGNYSRVESFNEQQASFVTSACLFTG